MTAPAPAPDLADGVRRAVEAFSNGVLAAMGRCADDGPADEARPAPIDADALARYSTVIVFRLVFLLMAEARGMLHPRGATATARRRYAREFSLIDRPPSTAQHQQPQPGGWARLARVGRALAGDAADSELGLPGIGSWLWSDVAASSPDCALDSGLRFGLSAARGWRDAPRRVLPGGALKQQRVARHINRPEPMQTRPLDAALASALSALTHHRGAAPPVCAVPTWRSRDLGVAYEGLLARQPEISRDPAPPNEWRFRFVARKNAARRRRGVFYTPPALVEHVLDRALGPTIRERAARGAPPPCVADPACGCGAFLLAAVDRLAQAHRSRSPRAARRRAVRELIFGLDIDPIAVELCRIAIWLESARPGEPFDRLNRRIVCGDALSGHRTAGAGWWAEGAGGPGEGDGSAEPFPQPPPSGRGSEDRTLDVVIGNPPFLNQLQSATAITRERAREIREWSGGAVGGYADAAAAFFLRFARLVRPGGRIALVQPMSFLASRDAGPVRESLLREGVLESLWLDRGGAFRAGVVTCVPTIRIHGNESASGAAPPRPPTTNPVRRFVSIPPVEHAAVHVNGDLMSSGGPWSALIAGAGSVPNAAFRGRARIADFADATADFRDQYYGLQGAIVEEAVLSAAQRADQAAFPRLASTVMIDPAECAWGRRPARILRQVWLRPRVGRARVARDHRMAKWMTARLVPKLLLATQTRVIEVFADERGTHLPLVPIITVTPHQPERFWHVAAALASPLATAEAVRRHAGAALSIDAIKLSARQVLDLPAPPEGPAWDAAADAFRRASRARHDRTRRDALLLSAERSLESFGVAPRARAALMRWWSDRLLRRTPAAVELPLSR